MIFRLWVGIVAAAAAVFHRGRCWRALLSVVLSVLSGSLVV